MLALTETRSRAQGRVEGEDHDLWESGADRAKGKALLVHTGGRFTADPEAVTEDVFVLAVRYREKDLAQVGVVQVLGRIPMRTDHRMALAEVQIRGTYRVAPMRGPAAPSSDAAAPDHHPGAVAAILGRA